MTPENIIRASKIISEINWIKDEILKLDTIEIDHFAFTKQKLQDAIYVLDYKWIYTPPKYTEQIKVAVREVLENIIKDLTKELQELGVEE